MDKLIHHLIKRQFSCGKCLKPVTIRNLPAVYVCVLGGKRVKLMKSPKMLSVGVNGHTVLVIDLSDGGLVLNEAILMSLQVAF